MSQEAGKLPIKMILCERFGRNQEIKKVLDFCKYMGMGLNK